MIIEHRTFVLADAVDEDDFLAADRRVQAEFAPFQPGFIRRTTARGPAGSWLVETMWMTEADAEAAAASSDAAVTELRAMVDPTSETVRRYETLD